MSNDWLPGKRERILEMALVWGEQFDAGGAGWGVPAGEITAFEGMVTSARTIFDKQQSNERTTVTTQQCNAAFSSLTAKMRGLYNNYLARLNDVDRASLMLPVKDRIRTEIPAPLDIVEIALSSPGVTLLTARLGPAPGQSAGDERSRYGFSIRYGVYDPALAAAMAAETGTREFEAQIALAAFQRQELRRVPQSVEELPRGVFTRRRTHTFHFELADSGKTAYFSACYENSKGDPGPYCPIIARVIP
jgi:hypothetical protein